jgi:ABC-type multidrug transport system fused ATPase/permease subunit
VRTQIAVVPQTPYLFHATLRDNLLVANLDASDAELDAACRGAQLYEFIATLPAGCDTLIGDNGLTLSGGERQRLAIAHALLKPASILILMRRPHTLTL